MGIVYRASHAMLHRPTALELLLPDRVGADALRRFEREVQLTAKLTNPNTITIFDYGRTPDGIFYYAMELVDGTTLDQVVQRSGAMPAARVLHILHQVAGALAEAHASGLIHRDVKPQNIMLCKQGGMLDEVKVLDFGLVKQIDAASAVSLTGTNVIIGTPQYMPPEAIKDPEDVDGRADLYALSAVGFYQSSGSVTKSG
jgi:serine/threonine protein kinase